MPSFYARTHVNVTINLISNVVTGGMAVRTSHCSRLWLRLTPDTRGINQCQRHRVTGVGGGDWGGQNHMACVRTGGWLGEGGGGGRGGGRAGGAWVRSGEGDCEDIHLKIHNIHIQYRFFAILWGFIFLLLIA